MIDFTLWAECENDDYLHKMKEHFHNLRHTLLSGREINFRLGTGSSSPKGLSVLPTQICPNGHGVETFQDVVDVTETGIFLYHLLLTAPDFRFAHVGWDSERTFSEDLPELVDIMKDGRKWLNFECVVNDSFYKQLGSPAPFLQFREGYWWNKYSGESYNPLFSADQIKLRELCELLLPGNLD